MAKILPIANYQIKRVAEERIVALGESAMALEGIPFDVLASIILCDDEDRRIDAKLAISKVALLLLDILHEFDSYQAAKKFESDLIEHGKPRL